MLLSTWLGRYERLPCHRLQVRPRIRRLLRRKLGTDDIIEVGDVETFSQILADTAPIQLLFNWRLYVHSTRNLPTALEGTSSDGLVATLTPLLRKEY